MEPLWNMKPFKCGSLCGTSRNLNLYVEPLWNLEPFDCGTVTWNIGEPEPECGMIWNISSVEPLFLADSDAQSAGTFMWNLRANGTLGTWCHYWQDPKLFKLSGKISTWAWVETLV